MELHKACSSKGKALWLWGGMSFLALVSGRSLPGVLRIGARQMVEGSPVFDAVGAMKNSTAEQLAANNKPSPSSGSSSSTSNYIWIYAVGFGSALFLIITISLIAILYLRHKRKPTAVSPWKQGMSGQLSRVFETSLTRLKREEVEAACEDFSNIIGSSTDSVVYKGTLANGTEIAATSIRVAAANWTSQSELCFRRKVEALARMKHSQLVNLVGYCSEEDPFTRILIFEYASNGTLHDHLHNKESEHLDWATRMRVVMGTACALSYMHHELNPPASHLNFDTTSIYLTDDYAAKVANFGVTKMTLAKTERQRTRWLGFRAVGNDDTESSDRQSPDFESNMYSFGVFMLEVITGRLPQSEHTGSLVDWANEYLTDAKMVWYMVDPTLKSYNHDELVALCKIVTVCLSSRSRRPSMRKVTSMLSDALKMTPESAAPKSTALLWAQLELQDDTTES